MRKILILLVLICFVFVNSCTDYDLEEGAYSEQKIQEINYMMDQCMDEGNVPGAIIGVWQLDLEPLIITKGEANIKTKEALEESDRFRIASITKTFTAAVVLQLIDEGAFKLDDTINRWFPEIPHAKIITVRQMLNMTSGIYDVFYHDPAISWSAQNEPRRIWKTEDLYEVLMQAKPAFNPGDRCVYSNANYFLLGLLIEMETDNELEEEIQTRLLDPLEMNSTSFPTTPRIPGEYSHGYRDLDYDGRLEDITTVDPSLSWAAGAIISNLYDLKTWTREMYYGELLSGTMQQKRLDMQTMDGPVSYGLGIMKIFGFYGHNGSILGFSDIAVYLPEKDAIIVCMMNKRNDDGSKGDPDATNLMLETAKILFPDEF